MNLNTILEQFETEVSNRAEQKFIASIVGKLDLIVGDMVAEDVRQRRKSLKEMTMLLQFYQEQQKLKAGVASYLKLYLGSLDSGYNQESVLIRLDCYAYIAFELLNPEDKILIERIRELKTAMEESGGKWPFFASSLRRSFLKSFAIFSDTSIFETLATKTVSDESKELFLLNFVLNKERLESRLTGHALSYLTSLPDKNIKSLAKDCRRFSVDGGRHRRLSPVQLETVIDHIRKSNADRAIAILLLLAYSGEIGVSQVNLLMDAFYSDEELTPFLSTLAAMLGYDHTYLLGIHRGIVDAGAFVRIPSVMGFDNLQSYFGACTEEWASTEMPGPKVSTAPLVSIIFSVYNPDVELMRLAVKSIVIQDYPNLEIIFIDDCSHAEAGETIKDIVSAECSLGGRPMTYVRNTVNMGQYKNRNLGIELANGEYVGIQDDDDISHPERVSKQIELMHAHESIYASHVKHIRFSEGARLMLDADKMGDALGDAPPSFIWKKNLFSKVGKFIPTKTRGDVEFYRRIKKELGDKAVVQINSPLLLMRGSVNTISSQKEYWYKGSLEALRYVMNNLNIHDFSSDKNDLSRLLPTAFV